MVRFCSFASLPPPAGWRSASRTRRIRAGCTPPCRATPEEARTATVRQWVSSNVLSSFHLLSLPSTHPTCFFCPFSNRQQCQLPLLSPQAKLEQTKQPCNCKCTKVPTMQGVKQQPSGCGGGGCPAGIFSPAASLNHRDSSVYARRGPVLLLSLHGFLIVWFVPYSIFKHFISCTCRCRFM